MDIEALIQALQRPLPGEMAHTELMPINRPYSSEIKKNAADYRSSAVAIVLFQENSIWNSILIQRPEYEGWHSAQVAFPGGKMDPDDLDLIHTARRECMEEIAIPMESLEYIGALSEIYIPVSKFIVKPCIFTIDTLPELIPDAREVSEILQFPVLDLISDEIIQLTDLTFGNGMVQRNIPYFSIHGKVVWGATAMILSELRTILRMI